MLWKESRPLARWSSQKYVPQHQTLLHKKTLTSFLKKFNIDLESMLKLSSLKANIFSTSILKSMLKMPTFNNGCFNINWDSSRTNVKALLCSSVHRILFWYTIFLAPYLINMSLTRSLTTHITISYQLMSY